MSTKTLLIVESKTKVEKLKHILGPKYEVVACFGHVMDLDPEKLSIDIDNGFIPNYIITGRSEVIKNLKFN